MSELLPALQAEATQSALVEYITTAIEFSDQYARDAFSAFLTDPDHGIFRGPFLRTRLPFEADASEPPLAVLPTGFRPYAHQAKAFRRLTTSPDVAGKRDRAGLRVPEPTIVTTGTGSGKTEAFLYPLLDYAVRARQQRVHGIKAIILYPMNALANDQAGRLARMIHENPGLHGVTAALYTGEHSGAPRTAMSADGLIEDRHTIRSSVPDIVLTNYKMLDQLLLRKADRPLWELSAESLRYLVLDEFHTYNGAQGTDVALLIRRLRLLLERLAPNRSVVIPVATSATLGDDRDIAPVAEFATTIFGTTFSTDAVVTERRMQQTTLQAQAHGRLDSFDMEAEERPTAGHLQSVLGLLPGSTDGLLPDPGELTAAVVDVLWTTADGEPVSETKAVDDAAVRDLFLAHPLVGQFLERTTAATTVADLSRALVPHLDPLRTGGRFVEALCAALSHVRSRAERNSFPNIEVHLWTREVSRVDRATSPVPAFAWSDDRTVHDGSFLPAVYCRHCGRSGWGVALTGTDDLIVKPQRIRQEHARYTGRFRALISGPGADPAGDDRLRYLDPERRSLDPRPPSEEAADVDSLPVLMHVGLEAEGESKDDTCPACREKDGIRFVGASTATLLSVALSSLFGTAGLDPNEKKSLVFTDSVQDAAHRSGFVEARSHSLALRSAIESSLDDQPLRVREIVERMMVAAGSPEDRYRLLHPSIAENSSVRGYWEDSQPARQRRRAQEHVAKRLEFDLELEAGLVGSYGRTLATTGTAAASVEVSAEEALAIGQRVLDRAAQQFSIHTVKNDTVDDHRIEIWIRGVLERLRADGAIAHEWLIPYRKKGGMRYQIWGGRPQKDVMPAFPPGRRSPHFPATGKLKDRSELRDPGNRQSWFADWTARCLHTDRRTAGHLMKPLFAALTRAGLTDTVPVTEHGRTSAESYGLEPERVVMARVSAETRVLRCTSCGETVTGIPQALDIFSEGPCTAYRCTGRLQWADLQQSYYRSLYTGDMRRVIAREHTSLLPTDTRLEYENAFKARDSPPGAPNVLVATPTLEMGIDIGDLSTVILASIPDTVASYLQRVGRAGRLTGNSLDLAFMSTRGRGSAYIEPEFMVNGSVRPPAAYLSAEEILHRQYIAFLMDRMAGDDDMPVPARGASVMRSSDSGTFLGEMLADARAHSQDRLDEFLSDYDTAEDPRRGITREAADALRQWATWTDDDASGLQSVVSKAVQRWRHEKDALRHRRQRIARLLRDIAEGKIVITADDDSTAQQLRGQQELLDHQERKLGEVEDAEARAREEKRLTGSQFRLRAEESQMSHEHWIGVLERFGLLPNFTLFDDAVRLDVTLIYQDDDNQWQHIPADYERSGFTALTELAPGNHFYAGGHELTIDAVDLGTDGAGVRRLAFCPDCGSSHEVSVAERLTTCPKCRHPGIADEGQHLHVVELNKVYSTMELHRAKIGDSSDDRTSLHFETLTVPDFTDAETRARWSIEGTGVGVAFRRGTRLTRLNVGRPREGAPETVLAGQKQRIGGFTICAECGHLNEDLQTNTPQNHQAWCSQRRAEQPESATVVLSRELVTETVVISLPPSIGEDSSGLSLWSFYAALMLGLRERFGGEVSHLRMETIPDTSRQNAPSLLLYDSVPGGTGYLAEFASPESLWELFHAALRRLAECPCRHEERFACFRCLMPHVRASHRESLSRARAVEILTTVLNSTNPTADMTWRITDGDAPAEEDFESQLEKRFRRVFRAAVAEIPGARVTDTVSDGGDGFSAVVGDVKYTYTPQVTLGHTQPDALLSWSGQPGVRGVAIYLDGKAYHATVQHNRLGEDAQKRAALRDQGYLVFAVTDRDLTAFEAQRRGDSAAENVLDDLMAPQFADAVMSRGLIDAGDRHYLTANPVEQLLELLQRTGRDPLKRQRAVSQYLNLLLFDGKPEAVSTEDLGGHALSVVEAPVQGPLPPAPEGPNPGGFIRRSGPLTVLGTISPPPNWLAIVLDDREDALRSEDFDLAWRRWLALANLRQELHSASTTLIETWSSLPEWIDEHTVEQDSWVDFLVQAGQQPRAGSENAPPRSADAVDVVPVSNTIRLGSAWIALIEDALTPAERHMLEAAGRQGMPLPEVGEEFAGIPIDLAWPDLGIAWLSEASLAEELTRNAPGEWTVLDPDVQSAQQALREFLQTEKREMVDP
ncbi:DEAD/DEAH box helicase [Citricoccus alkalitolerans]|uniref:DEAD/DEAH box helicase n=1 Tax=Citricoccus alkalitolerans TaxID=246603 RepID=A0ABV8XYT1_9MICC